MSQIEITPESFERAVELKDEIERFEKIVSMLALSSKLECSKDVSITEYVRASSDVLYINLSRMFTNDDIRQGEVETLCISFEDIKPSLLTHSLNKLRVLREEYALLDFRVAESPKEPEVDPELPKVKKKSNW